MPEKPGSPDLIEARVWDIPIRLFHWLLVVCVSASWLLGEFLAFSTIQWHFYLGYATGGLIVFRLIWGMVGPAPARLGALLPSPGAVLGHIFHLYRRTPSGDPGHNPLGALAVLALLATLAVTVLTGLFAEDDDLFTGGPLSSLLSEPIVHFFNEFHESAAEFLLVLITIHVSALVFYLVWKRENLIRPMITGWKFIRRT